MTLLPHEDRLQVSTKPTDGLLDTSWELWGKAPAWRNLTIAAVCLGSMVVTVPLLKIEPVPEVPIRADDSGIASSESAAAPQEETCRLQPGNKWMTRVSQVVGFGTPEQAAEAIKRTQAKMGTKISPDYTTQQRALVEDSFDGAKVRNLALIPEGLTVHVGDNVEIFSSYRDPKYPCNYVPRVIRRVVKAN